MKNTIKLISMAIIVICISAFTIGKTTLSEGYKIGDVANWETGIKHTPVATKATILHVLFKKGK